jgi:NAD(P)H dehydrogenase (quinone)
MNQASNKTERLVAIFGATGAQGKPVVDCATKLGLQVRALSRSGHFCVDLGQQSSIERSLQGVDAAFLHLPIPQAPEQSAQFLTHFIAAAKAVRLPHLVFSSSSYGNSGFRSSPIIDGNRAATQALLNCGIPTIVLQPTLYLENLYVDLFAPQLRSHGVLDYPPLPNRMTISWTSLKDQAIVATAALLRPDLAGSTFNIASHQRQSGLGLADILADVLKRPVTFRPLSPKEFGDRVTVALGNPGVGFVLSDLYSAIAISEPSATKVDVERLEQAFGVTLGSVSSRLKEMFTAPG